MRGFFIADRTDMHRRTSGTAHLRPDGRKEVSTMRLKIDEQGKPVMQDDKPVYTADDGKDIPVDIASTIATIGRLNGECKSQRERAEAFESKLKTYEGIEDPAAAIKALETMKNIKDGDLISAGKAEEIKLAAKKAAEEQVADANKSFTLQLAQYKTDNEKLTQQLYTEKIGGAFTRSKLIAEKFAIPADMVQARFGGAFKVEGERVVAYDQSGNKIYSRTRPGDLAEFDEALEYLVDVYPHRDAILKGSNASGGGAQGNGSGLGTKDFSTMSPVERMNYGREHQQRK